MNRVYITVHYTKNSLAVYYQRYDPSVSVIDSIPSVLTHFEHEKEILP